MILQRIFLLFEALVENLFVVKSAFNVMMLIAVLLDVVGRINLFILMLFVEASNKTSRTMSLLLRFLLVLRILHLVIFLPGIPLLVMTLDVLVLPNHPSPPTTELLLMVWFKTTWKMTLRRLFQIKIMLQLTL